MAKSEDFHLLYKKSLMFCITCSENRYSNDNVFLISKDAERLIKFCGICGFGITCKSLVKSSGFRRFNVALEFLLKCFRLGRSITMFTRHSFKTKLKILDYGCGRGEFLYFMNRLGWTAVGTEYSLESSYEALDKGIPIFFGEHAQKDLYEHYGNAYFDVITSYHNLEHLDDPRDFLSLSWDLLKKRGMLLLEVPNIESLQYLISKEDWLLLDIENHKFHFSRKSLEALLVKHGFYILKQSTFSMNYGLIGMIEAMKSRITRIRDKSRQSKIQTPGETKLLKSSLVTILFLLVPSLVLELLSVFMKRGAVIRIHAIKI